MEQTAVKWFALKLYEKFEMKGDGKVFDELLEQAKEMEKQQIIDAYVDGGEKGFNKFGENFEQYYNETFKLEEECCPKCGESENIHTNYDWSKKERPVEEYLCNECGTYFKPRKDDKTRD